MISLWSVASTSPSLVLIIIVLLLGLSQLFQLGTSMLICCISSFRSIRAACVMCKAHFIHLNYVIILWDGNILVSGEEEEGNITDDKNRGSQNSSNGFHIAFAIDLPKDYYCGPSPSFLSLETYWLLKPHYCSECWSVFGDGEAIDKGGILKLKIYEGAVC